MLKKHRVLSIAIPSLILVLLAAFAIRLANTKAASSKSSCSWQVVSAPTAGQGTHLYSLAALSSSDIWSAGEYLTIGGGEPTKTLIENWNGTQWSIVNSPSIGKNNNSLGSIAAVSANNVWAVGSATISNPFHYKVLIEHWNGAKWYVMPGPVPSQEGGGLSSVSVISANDIWAVGSYYNNGFTSYTLAAHWNGKQWNMISTPNPQSSGNFLNSVVALSSNDVWAVGGSFSGPNAVTLIEHWNGTQWSVVNSLNPGTDYNDLSSVTALSATNIWAVGDYHNHQKAKTKTLVEHWDGAQWSVVNSPNVTNERNNLSQVTALSATNIWAVGYTQNQGGTFAPEQTLIEHWDGANWRLMSSPNPGQTYNILNAVTRVPHSSQVWIIGTEGLYYGVPLTAYC